MAEPTLDVRLDTLELRLAELEIRANNAERLVYLLGRLANETLPDESRRAVVDLIETYYQANATLSTGTAQQFQALAGIEEKPIIHIPH